MVTLTQEEDGSAAFTAGGLVEASADVPHPGNAPRRQRDERWVGDMAGGTPGGDAVVFAVATAATRADPCPGAGAGAAGNSEGREGTPSRTRTRASTRTTRDAVRWRHVLVLRRDAMRGPSLRGNGPVSDGGRDESARPAEASEECTERAHDREAEGLRSAEYLEALQPPTMSPRLPTVVHNHFSAVRNATTNVEQDRANHDGILGSANTLDGEAHHGAIPRGFRRVLRAVRGRKVRSLKYLEATRGGPE